MATASPTPLDAANAQQLIADSFRSGEIDDPANLADDRVWLFRGDLDAVVPAAVADSLADLYRLPYSGDGWRTREGVQMRAVASIIERLLGR